MFSGAFFVSDCYFIRMSKIVYGYELPKLPDNNKWLSILESDVEDYPLYPFYINPEESVDPACHLYTLDCGVQIIGFEVALGLATDTMNMLLNNAAEKKLYRV